MAERSGWISKGYEIKEVIDKGGFGAVYRAVQPVIGREVAIKVILPVYANRPEFIRRFEAEAQLVARLEHPHIVPLYDYWRDPDGAYLVMRWLRGGSLRSRLHQGGLPLERIAVMIEQIAAALTIAHRNGVIHRDLKPENILLDEDDNAYLTDFGIAKDLASTEDDDGVTGSPAYVSPEQIVNGRITGRTDVYSLGIMLYELLTGQQPFRGESAAHVIVQHLHDPAPRLTLLRPDLPPVFDNIIHVALQKDPEARFGDVLSLSQALWRAVQRTQLTEGGPLQFDSVPPTVSETLVITDLTPAPGINEVQNPYKGLRPFEAVDADQFFGREKLTQQLIARMNEDDPLARFLAVVGPSGSGKSSVVKAGVIPALRHGALEGSQDWFLVELVPGLHPLQELETALLRVAVNKYDELGAVLRRDARGLAIAAQAILPPGHNNELALFIDQFEEAFTLAADAQESAHYLDLLANAVTDPYCPIRIVITLRADFYDRPLLHPAFSDLISKRTAVVVPLSPSEIERAITAPAESVGVVLDPQVVRQVINEVRNEPGALPLLQYALTELFDRREERFITMTAYEKIGGVLGALARRADELYDTLSPQGRAAAKQLFLRLVTLGEGTEDTRRRANLSELLSMGIARDVMDDIINIFGKYRLLTFDRDPLTRSPTVEVAHEAILREWNQLKMWLDNSREDVRSQRRLVTLLREWQGAGRDPSLLLRGMQLQQFEYWRQQTDMALAQEEQEFLAASSAAREQEQAAERARQQRERALELRAQRVQRNLLLVMTAAAVIALLLALLAFNQRSEAVQNAATATVAQGLALVAADNAATAAAIAGRRADELQALSLAEDAQSARSSNNTDLGLALALQANSIAHPPLLAQRVLTEMIPAAAMRLFSGGHNDRITAVFYSPDGLALVSTSSDGRLVMWDVRSGVIMRQFSAPSGINAGAYLPDGSSILLALADSTLALWDVEQQSIIRRYGLDGGGHQNAVFSVAVSHDGLLALSGARDASLILWDVTTGQIVWRLEGHTDRITSVAISPDGTRGLSGAADNSAIVWNLANGSLLYRLSGHSDAVTAVAFSPRDNLALTGSIDTTLILWNLATGQLVRRLEGHAERVTSLAFTPDGRTALSGAGSPFAGATLDNSALLWDLQNGQVLLRFTGHSAQITSLAVSPDGGSVITGSADQTLREWALEPDLEIGRLLNTMPITDMALTADGRYALTVDAAFYVTLWDLTTLENVSRFQTTHTQRINAIAVSPDGQRALTASDDRTLLLWNVSDGRLLAALTGHTNQIKDVVWSADGRLALSGSRDRTLIVWDVDAASATFGQSLRVFPARHTNIINAAALSADGTLALSASADRTLILWDVATGTALRTLEGHEDDVLSVAFAPDGRSAVSGSADKTLILWDIASGAIVQRFGTASSGHSDWVTSVTFSSDGLGIISGARDRSVRMWDIASGQEMWRYGALNGRGGHRDTVTALAVSTTSSAIVSGSLDGTLRLWPDTIEALLTWVRANRYVRELTCAEREQFRVEPLCAAAGAG
ncbi:MAG: protein kinase [Chloroflexi bacterium]|nr:protein kinase [Chloroflexota bacterium]